MRRFVDDDIVTVSADDDRAAVDDGDDGLGVVVAVEVVRSSDLVFFGKGR